MNEKLPCSQMGIQLTMPTNAQFLPPYDNYLYVKHQICSWGKPDAGHYFDQNISIVSYFSLNVVYYVKQLSGQCHTDIIHNSYRCRLEFRLS